MSTAPESGHLSTNGGRCNRQVEVCALAVLPSRGQRGPVADQDFAGIQNLEQRGRDLPENRVRRGEYLEFAHAAARAGDSPPGTLPFQPSGFCANWFNHQDNAPRRTSLSKTARATCQTLSASRRRSCG